MKSRVFRFGAMLAVTVFCLGGAAWAFGLVGPKKTKEKLTDESRHVALDPSIVVVTTEPVLIRKVERTVEAVGTLYGYEEVVISTKVEGRIKKIQQDVSDRVSPGALLLEIDPTDYDLSTRQAERALQVELAKLGLKEMPGPKYQVSKLPVVLEAAARRDNFRARLERARTLSSQRILSPEELADRQSECRVAEAEYDNQVLLAEAGLATINVKQEALAMAKQQLKDTHVCAPIPTQTIADSTQDMTYAISQRSVSEGSFVKSGMEVFRLVIDQTLKLKVMVPERHLRAIQLGQKADVITAAFKEPFPGKVTRINPSVDPTTRTFEVEVRVPNPKGLLKPGAFAKAAIVTDAQDQAATVPLEALVNFAGIIKVFTVVDGKAKEVQVVLGVQSTRWVEVAKPALPEGAIVVTSGQTALADGTSIVVRDKTQK
jgi:RND family efflux transporter MFP subunit